MELTRTERFQRDFAALPRDIQRRAQKQLARFVENPRPLSLRVGKLEGHESIFYGRITRSHRFTFEQHGDTVILRRIGPHEILKTP